MRLPPLRLYASFHATGRRLVPKGRNSATTDPDIIKAWWAKYPQANIGIATGHSSNSTRQPLPQGIMSMDKLKIWILPIKVHFDSQIISAI
jgi:Bifunctional DNA primase/polymerase, N-terminal